MKKVKIRSGCVGDVTTPYSIIGNLYPPGYALICLGPDFEITGIAVENLNFSTISTGFSTGLFHRGINRDIHFEST